MSEILVATASVHTTAAACDYLESRVGGEDTVYVLTVTTAGRDAGDAAAGRDAGDAANVARTRLFGSTVEALRRPADGETASDVAAAIRTVAEEYGIAEIVVGATRGDPERAGEPPGSTVRALLETADRPVVVVPIR